MGSKTKSPLSLTSLASLRVSTTKIESASSSWNNASGMAGNDPKVDNRSITQLMLDQIEFANVIVVSKASVFLSSNGEDKLQEIKALIERLNPKARVIVPHEDKYGDLDVAKELLNTGTGQLLYTLLDGLFAVATCAFRPRLCTRLETPRVCAMADSCWGDQLPARLEGLNMPPA